MRYGNMKYIKYTLLAALMVLLAVNAMAIPDNAKRSLPPQPPVGGPSLVPLPATIDQITHNVGNIVTTVDNAGYVGGYRYYDLPSGEWPRNSGHDYIGELKYWMGGIAPNGDTLVANTWDEFQGVTQYVSGIEEYKIHLSTDSSRYYQYDLSDTVGAGKGNPALGWRVWDPASEDYVYAENYDPQGDTFYPGGPTALQMSQFRFNDHAGGTALMDIEVTHTMLQWNYCYNEDITFVILDITNRSANHYTNFAFGLYVDLDVGGPDGTGENGRLGDRVGYDVAENLAWTYDFDGYDPGWGANVVTGFMGTKLLETPDNIGMTALRTGEWEHVPTDFSADDIPRYELMNEVAFDGILPPADQYYIQCTRGIDLTAGKTVRVVYALLAGADEVTLRANADRAQALYDKHFVGPQPPVAPTLSVRSGDRKAYISWNNAAEMSSDPLSGEEDFNGYKLYRSDNKGKTWGRVKPVTNNTCLTSDYWPVTSFRKDNPDDPIAHSFVDTNLHNGVEYWYCLAAFDKGDSTVPVDVLQNGFGVAGVAPNVVSVTPTKDPAGFFQAAATVTHEYTGAGQPSAGEVYPLIFSRDSLNGSEYQVVFEDTPEQTIWHLVNATTGDTLLANQTRTEGDPGLYTIADGIRVVVRDGDLNPVDFGQTALAGADTTLKIDAFYGPSIPALTGDPSDVFTHAPFRAGYELRYTGTNTEAPSVIAAWDGDPRIWQIPFEVWNTLTDQRVSLAIYDVEDNGTYEPYDYLVIVDYPYNPSVDLTAEAFPYYYGWIFNFVDTVYAPGVGDIFTIEGAPLNGPDDVFTFRIDGIDATVAAHDLKKIKVVPDPYFAQYSSQVETNPGQSVIEFQNVPDKCTIRIYTLAGDLVSTVEHNSGTGTARWDLLSANQQQIASGIYIYHVESPYGERLGRFAVIK